MTQPSHTSHYCPACGKAVSSEHRFCQHCGAALQTADAAMAQAAPSIDTAASKQEMLAQIRGEIEDLKAMAAAFGVERIRDGTWFNEFIRAMLDSYAERIIAGGGINFFRKKYPGLTRDQIAEKLCELATRYAALAGGASGATASAAFAATIGTAGGASIIAVPAGLTAIAAEMLYTTRLQVRLVYDLSTIYGYPIDVDDPEDLYKAFCMAYGVAFTRAKAGAAVKAAAPELARAHMRGLIHGHTAAIQQVAIRLLGPRIGRQITQRAILRTAVPVVGVGISATWNYMSTNAIATAARYGLRAVGRLRDAVCDVAHVLRVQPEDAPLVLEAMHALITADGHFDQYEQEVFTCVVRHLGLTPEQLVQVEQRVGITVNSVEQRLRAITDQELRETLATCLQLVAVADGAVVESELQLLRRFLVALEHNLDLEWLQAEAKLFQRPVTWTQQASESIGALGISVGAKISGWFDKRSNSTGVEPTASPETDEPSTDNPLDQIRKLAALHADGILSDVEFAAKKQELLARL